MPTRIDVTPNGGGAHDERAVLERTIEADRTYVMDRGYAKFLLFNEIVAGKQLRVPPARQQRLRSAGRTSAHRRRSRGERARRSDRRHWAERQGRRSARSSDPPDHHSHQPHTSRGKYRGGSTGPGSDGILRIATNLLDVPAEVIALDLSVPLDD